MSKKRFTPDPEGFVEYRRRTRKKLSDGTSKKWMPIIGAIEALRGELFGAAAWCELNDEDIAFELLEELFARCKSKSGGEPSTNTLRGRYDAAKAYFDFLVALGEIEHNPCRWQTRPDSKARLKPSLEPSEDAALSDASKEGHEIAVYALARGAALREGEICDLEDSDLDFLNDQITVRKGKTDAASRTVPMLPTTKVLLQRYIVWRDSQDLPVSSKFIRTRSGKISTAYVWKLTKAMALRAGVRVNGDSSDVTPHSLRRTFVSDFANNGVPTFAIAPVVGHSSSRVTDTSYAVASNEHRARQYLLAAGEGALSLACGARELESDIESAVALANRDPETALRELHRLHALSKAVIETVESTLRVAPRQSTPRSPRQFRAA